MLPLNLKSQIRILNSQISLLTTTASFLLVPRRKDMGAED